MGRKKMSKAGAKSDIRLRVEDDLRQRIEAAAAREGNAVAAFIRTAVVEKLERLERKGSA